ncbi:P-loop containing nucleoside triphosphate hydrolase protein [Crassisporium funariophilum]|nr:P-loop containing nucleoside triphosphate hydrolase protein [Crassisporium funariophilum]
MNYSIAAHKRLLVGVAGIPASGKSTFALKLTEHINDILENTKGITATHVEDSCVENPTAPQAILVGMDGWHLTRAQLDLFPDPKLAYDRRGIHWTFDGPAYVSFIRSLRESITTVITAPSFDHALKDPTPHAVSIHPHHRIVVIEGLYTFLAIEPWSEGGLLLDERWFIEVDPDMGRKRLVARHVLTGVTKDMEEAERRADENDIPNGLFIISNLLEPTRTIRSEDGPTLEP